MRLSPLLAGAAIFLAAACVPIQPASEGGAVPAPSDRTQPAALIRFDDAATTCAWASDGATLAFDGRRVNYTCTRLEGGDEQDAGVILGDIVATDVDSTFVDVTRGTVVSGSDGFALEDENTANYMIARVILLDPSGEAEIECLNAGQGATFGNPELGRANFTCGDPNAGPFAALFGPLVQSGMGEWSANFALVEPTSDGFDIQPAETLVVTILDLEEQ